MKIRIYFSLSMFLILGCASESIGEDIYDNFFLKNDEAVMPVHVRGNTTSNTFIVYLHGGPGFTAFEAYQNNESPFTMLQKDFAVVYWDQRCAGTAQGNCDYSKLNLTKYAQDLEHLMVLLKHRYGRDINLFLIGHSWGGALGIQYLSKRENQTTVKGWVEVGGGHHIPRIVELEREMVNEVGERQIQQGNFIVNWNRLIDEANTLDFSKTDDVFEMNAIAGDAEMLMRKADSVNKRISTLSFNDYLFGPVDFHAIQNNQQKTIHALKDELVQLDLSGVINDIKIPTLLIWGEYDFRVPPCFAKEAIEGYGSNNKELVIIENTAHFLQWQAPKAFYSLIHGFVNENSGNTSN